MTPLVWANFPLMLVFVLAIVGIPMWMVLRRPDKAQDHSDAHAYLHARAEVRAADALDEAELAQTAAMTAAATLPAPRQGRWQPAGPGSLAPGRNHPDGRPRVRTRPRAAAPARPGRPRNRG